jgi:predicted kinase
VDAKAYLRLAMRLLEPSRPMLVAIGGLSGSGKSTLARALAPDLGPRPGALVLRSDVIRKRLAGIDPLARLPPSAYGPAASHAVYRAIGRAATIALRAGHAVIADAVFAREGERRAIERVAQRLGVPFVGLWLDAPRATLAQRLAARRNDASDATSRVLEQQLGYDLGVLTWARIDAAAGAASVVRRARRTLRGR